jgi:chromate reductase, NAD(P)H dehydrogenase (quinone)
VRWNAPLDGLLLSASPSMAGGNRGLWALRVPLEHLGVRVFPDMFSLAQAHRALGSDGRISNAQLQERFDANIVAFMDLVEASEHNPARRSAGSSISGRTLTRHGSGRVSSRTGITCGR